MASSFLDLFRHCPDQATMGTATTCAPLSQTTRSLFSAESLVDEHPSLGTFD